MWKRTLAGDATSPDPVGSTLVPIRLTVSPDGPPVEAVFPLGDNPAVPARRPAGRDRGRRACRGGSPVLSILPTTKLWYGGAVDLRLGFDGLYRPSKPPSRRIP